MPQDAQAELVLDAKAALGEGSLWHAEKSVLYWVDIMGDALHIYDPATRRDRAIPVGQNVGTVVPRRKGGVMLAVQHGFASLDLETEKLAIIADPEAHLKTRMNDGKCDPAGRFWAGTLAYSFETGGGNVYCLDTDLSVRLMIPRVTVSNGIVWSLDEKTMYYIDTRTRQVEAFDYDKATGAISNRRVAVEIPEGQGSPDGMTGDAEGNLWIAHWGGWRVSRWDPRSGKHLATVHVPAAHVTSCAFGGRDLGDLYITTARSGLNEEALAQQPSAGGLFHYRSAVKGVRAFEFLG